jgi:hypothetical protein
MARSLERGITDDNIDYSLSLLKLPRFFFVIPICGFEESRIFNTRIFAQGGIYKASQASIQDYTVGYLSLDRPRQPQKAINSMSKNQRQVMTAVTSENWTTIKRRIWEI